MYFLVLTTAMKSCQRQLAIAVVKTKKYTWEHGELEGRTKLHKPLAPWNFASLSRADPKLSQNQKDGTQNVKVSASETMTTCSATFEIFVVDAGTVPASFAAV